MAAALEASRPTEAPVAVRNSRLVFIGLVFIGRVRVEPIVPQTRGSPLGARRFDLPAPIVKSIIRQAGLSNKEFFALMEK